MNYVLDLFTPETWKAFREHGATVTGFRASQKTLAQKWGKGDLLVCYLVRLSRWCGLLEIEGECYEDAAPIFRTEEDPWIIRYKVKPLVVLDLEYSLPIRLPEIWNTLSRTKVLEQNSLSWPGKAALQRSLVRITPSDGDFLNDSLNKQKQELRLYPFTDSDRRELRKVHETVRGATGIVSVVVPESDELEPEKSADATVLEEARESIKVQARLAHIGAVMGFDVWIPRSDRARVERELNSESRMRLLDHLPFNFNRVTFKTIENIDVLWLHKTTLVRAFEVEHTTAVFSGLLRMADLLALQPNIDIRLHIVAPSERRDKVVDEIQRPVFALLNKPLGKSCTFLPYEAINELSRQEHLKYMSDSVLEEYEISASDIDWA